MKRRLSSWLSDCAASIALMALALLLAAPMPEAAPRADAVTYLSRAGATDDHWSSQLAKRRLLRAEAVRGLRSGRGPADRSPAFPPSPLLAPVQRMLPSGSAGASGAGVEETVARATAYRRPAPTGPPRLG